MESTIANTPPKGELLCISKTSLSSGLIVCFNSYANRPGKTPRLPYETQLEGFRKLSRQDAHLIWFVESYSSWFIEHQDEILAILLKYVRDNRIQRIKLTGMSAGGYAAIRFAMLLDHHLASEDPEFGLLAFGVNAQTGFSDELVKRARDALAGAGRNAGELGRDPVMLAQAYKDAYGGLTLDLVELAATLSIRNLGIILAYDSENPIEISFCNDLTSLPYVLPLPQALNVGHSRGCFKLWTGESLWQSFDAVFTFDEIEPTDAPLVRLRG